MKKIVTLLLVIVLCMGLTATAMAELSTTTIDGKSYYQIANLDDWKAFVVKVNGGERNANAVLTQDIDFGGVNITSSNKSQYIITGTGDTNGYQGILDGGNHKIKNFSSNISSFALFQDVRAAGVVKNIAFENITLTNSGAVAIKDNYGKLENCTLANVSITKTTDCSVGGFVVTNYKGSVIDGCHVLSGSISVGSTSAYDVYAGGIVCDNRGTVQNCTNAATVTAVGARYVAAGGIVGKSVVTDINAPAMVFRCGNSGAITVECSASYSYPRAGGIQAYGNNTSNSYYNVEECYNTGAVTGKGNYTIVAGICAKAGSASSNVIKNCWNSGKIESDSSTKNGGASGIRGDGNAKVVNCLNVGSVISAYRACPLAYSSVDAQPGSKKLVNSYALDGCIRAAEGATLSGTNYYGYDTDGIRIGTGVSSTELTDGTVLGNLNVDDVWTQGTAHPVLKNAASAPAVECNIQVSANPANGGAVTGGGTHESGKEVTVTATASEGYQFVNWMENEAEVSTDASYTFTITKDRALTANFELIPHSHTFEYSYSGKTITATCTAADCTDTDGGSVSISAPMNLIYTGSAIEAVVTDNLKTGDTVTVEYVGSNLVGGKPVVPGSYTAKIVLGGKEISVDYEITKATLSVSGEATASGTYGATLDELTLNASGLTVTPNVAGTWTLNVDHGNYIAIFTPNENAGCYETLTTPVKLNLANKSVTAVITVVDKMYDGTATAEVKASVAASDLVSDDSIIISGLTGTFADINVGADKVVTVVSSGASITGTGAENYNVTIPATATASISKKPLTITANAQSIAFGGSISQTEYTCGELAAGDTLENVTLTASGTDGVGTGTITPSAAKIVRGTADVTGNYHITCVDGVLSVGKQTIGSVSVAVTAPVQGAVPQSSVSSGTGYTAEISWSPAATDGVFGFNAAYTATVTLTPDSNHAFANTTTIPEEFSKTLNADGTLTLTKTFANTRVPNLTKLKTELGNTLSVYCKDAAEAIALLPKQMTFETEVGDLALDVVWSCDSYNSEVGKTNIFAWTALNAWGAVKDSYNQNDVPLSSTVNLTNAQAIPITITGVAAAQNLVYDGTVKQGYTGTPTSAEYAGPFTITYTGTEADGSSYGPTSGLPIDAGAYIVTIAVPATGTAYSGQTQISFSIAKAVPTGEPVSTPIYRDGKTLADAGLTTDGGTFSVDGTVTWNDPLTTVVEEGKAYEWTFMPTDSGNYEPITGSMVVYPVGDAPVISEPAEVQTISVEPGSTATMTVSAQGTGELAYQWYISYDGGKTFEAINGATQPSYTTSAVTTENNGYQYYCLVTNLYGETKSPVFTLSVLEPAVLPQTGDNSSMALWLMLMGLAGAGMYLLRKRAHN